MAKRILAWLLCAAMVFSFVPAVAVAAETEAARSPKAGGHDSAVHKCEACDSEQWEPWPADGTIPKEGHYYLTDDVTLSGMVSVKENKTLHICLNGFVIRAAENKRVMSSAETGAQIVITDCTAFTDEAGVYHAGALTGGVNVGKSGAGAVYVATGAQLHLYDGRITGNISKHDEANGGAIVLGTKSGSTPGAKFYMYGGEISNNAPYKANGTTLRGGGAIYAGNGALIEITGGQIYGNTGGSGGAFNLQGGSTTHISNAVITGNTGTNGGAIYGTGACIVSIKDTVITGNIGTSTNAAGRCAAVFFDGAAQLTVSGKTVIDGNDMALAGIPDLVQSATKTHTLYINDLEEGSRMVYGTTGFEAVDAKDVFVLNTQQTEPWNSGWVKYQSKSGVQKDIGLLNGEFVWGHYHGAQEYTALQNADQLEAGGYCYLADDLVLNETATLDKKNMTVDLCLNGHALSPKKDVRLMKINGTRNIQVTVDDCTAYTDENGVYHAGELSGADNTGNNGGLIQVGSTNVLTLNNGKITGNKGKSGGALILDGTFHLAGGEVCENESVNNGGAVYVNSGGTFQMSGGVMRNNKGADGGAFYATGTVTVTGGAFIGNQAGNGAAIVVQSPSNAPGTRTALFRDVTITGNTAQNSGALYIGDRMGTVTLAGNVNITGNISGNLHLSSNFAGVDVSDLTGSVGVTLSAPRMEAGQLHVTVQLADGVDPSAHFTSDDLAYATKLENKQIVLVKTGVEPPPATTHIHNGCNDTACTDHAQISYQAWTDANALPAEGSWYLDTDVTVGASVNLTKNVNLCLNGHTITQKSGTGARMYNAAGDAGVKLTIADCTAKTENGVYTAGKITGFAGKKQGAVIEFLGGNCFELYDGIITKNTNTASGGALFMNSPFNMYGGEISYNSAGKSGAWKNGGGLYLNAKSSFTMTGGSFIGNTADEGGALFTAKGVHMVISNAVFKDNEAKDAGAAVVSRAGGSLKLTDTVMTGNVAAGIGGAIYCISDTVVENCTITDNQASAGAGIYVFADGSLTLTGKNTITGNTTGSEANNVYLVERELVNVQNLSADSMIGITAQEVPRAFSAACDDFSKQFVSDDVNYMVTYADGALRLDVNSDHKHCLCAMTSSQCAHDAVTYVEWTNPKKLPTSGNYYLGVDVVLSSRAGLRGTELNLCLNGHTITTQDKRAFYLYEDSVLRISDCAKEPGKITGATASAIYADSSCDGALVELYNGVFTGNEGTSLGGAVALQGKTTFNMYGGKITGNALHCKLSLDADGNVKLNGDGSQAITSTRGGGGVGMYGKNTVMHMYAGEISDNETTMVAYLDKNGKQTNGGGFGGGIHCDKGSLYIHGGVISGNTTDRTGGGVFVQNAGLIEITGGKIIGNTCGASGGGIYISSNCIANISGGEVTGNTAKNAGGFHANTGAKVTMTGGKVSDNTTSSSGGGIVLSGKGVEMTMTGGEISGNSGASGGGMVVQSRATMNLNGGKVSGNNSSNSGAGIYVSGNSFLNMNGGSVTGNSAKGDGGGLALVRCEAKLNGGSISYNSTEKNGGAIRISGAKVTASGVNFIGNTAKKHAGGIVTGSSSTTTNGVKVPYYVTLNLNNCYFSGNECQSSGGAMLLQSTGTVVNVNNCKFHDNYAKSGGGGFYVSSNVTFTMRGGAITDNYTAAGGGVRLGACKAQFSDVLVQNNEAKKNGGGFYCSGSGCQLTLNNVQVLDNRASTAAGVYISKATVDMTDVKISGNASNEKSGGGLYMTGRAKLTMEGCEVSKNSCATLGGGIYIARGGTAEFTNTDFLYNTNEGNGGAVNCGGSMTFTGCNFVGNSSKANGGAICTNKTGSQWTQDKGGAFLTDCTMTDNMAAGLGGALYIDRGGPAHLTKVTITDNTAKQEGGGIYCDGIMELTDVTVTDNTSGGAGYAVYVGPGEWDGYSYTTGMRKLTGNVIIRDNENGDMYLAEGAVASVVGTTLGDDAVINVTLCDGVLTQRVIGVYHYEGSDLNYTLTAGDRSITEPMAPEGGAEPADEQTAGKNAVLYVGIGVFAAAVAAVAVLLVLKKKKAGKPAEEATKE